MTEGPRFQLLGEADTLVCEDGVCAVPEAGVSSEAAAEPTPPER